MNIDGVLIFACYAAAFVAALIGLMWYDRWRRGARHPLPENLRLLRMPGEYLWRRVIQKDEQELQWFLFALVLPVVAFCAIVKLVAWCAPSSPKLLLVTALSCFSFSLCLALWVLRTRFRRRADEYLGCIGERYVAEWLDPLKAKGWFIFHDVPFQGAAGPFNIDHVAVGPCGVWAVETKTYRKRKGKPGRKPHEVEFDGTNVIWPWFEESKSIKQASSSAGALHSWLEQMTGKSYYVAAALTLPGYCVIERKLTSVRVANPKLLPDVLTSPRNPTLPPADIDLIRRQLEAKCRDIEY